ncbi:hypothetical protein BH10PLA2_BH10PLA2_34950 [soil metagenome]
MAIVDCPGCHKAINVPANKLGRWIACPVCKMEFAALVEDAEQEEAEPEADDAYQEAARPRRLPSARVLLPLGLLLFVFLVGGIVYAVARNSGKKSRGDEQTVTATPRSSMPPVGQGQNLDGLGGLEQLLQQGGGGGGIGSLLGMGSSIQSFVYWTTIFSIGFLISSIGMLIWVARDSRNRGLESVASWITPILLTNIVAFLVYFMSRPQGKLVSCRHCQQRCLENASTCPHCRRKKPVRKARTNLDD